MLTNPPSRKVRRISVSLPEPVYRALDQLAADRGLRSRSKAVADMVTQFATDRREAQGDGVMAGTITVVYRQTHGNLLGRLASLERTFLKEVISSLHVQLENDHRMEVLLVQGPVAVLHRLVDRLSALKGVQTGKLTLTSTVLPPLHPRTLDNRPPSSDGHGKARRQPRDPKEVAP